MSQKKQVSDEEAINQLSQALTHIHNLLILQTSKAINISLTIRNWLYGYFIQEYELGGKARAEYGEKLLTSLSNRLKKNDIPSSSLRHLKLCRQFYQAYPHIGQTVFAQFKTDGLSSLTDAIGQTLLAQLKPINQASGKKSSSSLPANELLNSLSYSHFLELMKLDEALKRHFYEIECVRGNWSTRELKRQIASLYFERCGLSKDKKKLVEMVKNKSERNSPRDLVRDPYIFEFLDLKPSEIYLESKLADALIDKLQKFLLELGKGFCFEARNKRLLIGDEFFFVDLVLYHRILKCHVILELKVDKFNHEHIGQLNTYLNYFKRHEMSEGDNPPIGILLCTEKNHALVEYAMADSTNNLFVSKYKLSLPSKKELQKFVEEQLSFDPEKK